MDNENKQPLTIDDAVNIVNQREHNDKLMQAEIFFTMRIQQSQEVNEELGQSYYYLLRCKLQRNILYETKDVIGLYHKMRAAFLETEKKLWKSYKKNKSPVEKIQLEAFYRLNIYYFGSLESIYLKLNFDDSSRMAYVDKMNFRQNLYRIEHQYVKWLGYWIMKLTSSYGTSFLRWGITGIIFVIFFGLLYGAVDLSVDTSLMMVKNHANYGDYFYYSIVTFTTLGYGDIVPITLLHKIFASIEVIFGYFMLGIFLNLLHKKL